ncbi:Alpha-ketoglutarate-dependent dioxygenase alkB 7, mitochondrial [Podochytrium sp. JEL0797]|nr:Alpha-ketoglutarate-dependent dioxygenase alkB 7, mitochondrial [Podochytrium sp. JEL0797]
MAAFTATILDSSILDKFSRLVSAWSTATDASSPQPDLSSLVDFTHLSPKHRKPLPSELQIVPGFLSPAIHDMLLEASTRKLARLARGPYLEGHFDGVIKGYKEASVSAWSRNTDHTGFVSQGVFPPLPLPVVRDASDASVSQVIAWLEDAFNTLLVRDDPKAKHVSRWLPPHILELREGNSGIGAHVDHVEAFGDVIAGVCLGSDAVMRFESVEDPTSHFEALLPKGCLYFQRGYVRYAFSHAIPLAPEEHVFKGVPVVRGRRVSLMIRDALLHKPEHYGPGPKGK